MAVKLRYSSDVFVASLLDNRRLKAEFETTFVCYRI